jgi:hypothetical protein
MTTVNVQMVNLASCIVYAEEFDGINTLTGGVN